MNRPGSPERLDVVAVAPHPDDLEILCGGTLAKLVKQGYKVGIFDLTSGEPTPRGSLETRKTEAEDGPAASSACRCGSTSTCPTAC